MFGPSGRFAGSRGLGFRPPAIGQGRLQLIPRGPEQRASHHVRVLGLDLGQAHDPAAGAVLEHETHEEDFVGPPDPHVRMLSLKRYPLGTDYNDVVSDALDARCHAICFDFGGVGRPVRDMFLREAAIRQYQGRLIPVCSVGSNSTARLVNELSNRGKRGHFNVPKLDMIGALQGMMSCGGGTRGVTDLVTGEKRTSRGRLVFLDPKKHPEMGQLQREMREMREVKKSRGVTQPGIDPVDQHHFDLVCALALGCWWVLQTTRRRRVSMTWGGDEP